MKDVRRRPLMGDSGGVLRDGGIGFSPEWKRSRLIFGDWTLAGELERGDWTTGGAGEEGRLLSKALRKGDAAWSVLEELTSGSSGSRGSRLSTAVALLDKVDEGSVGHNIKSESAEGRRRLEEGAGMEKERPGRLRETTFYPVE